MVCKPASEGTEITGNPENARTVLCIPYCVACRLVGRVLCPILRLHERHCVISARNSAFS